MSSWGWRVPGGTREGGSLAAASAAAALAVLMLAGGRPVQAQGEIGNVCVGDFVQPANCTANDVDVGALFVETLVESCDEGVPFEAEVVFDGLLLSNSPDRFGIGVFVSLDGESAVTGDLCLHDYLAPFSNNPGEWQTDPVTGAFIEPFPELNEDQCGDIPSTSLVQRRLQQVRIACVDPDGDGFVDVSACVSWENNPNVSCGGLQNAVPASPSKCSCRTVPTPIPMPPSSITIVKETVGGDGTFPYGGDLGGFEITTTGGTGSVGFPDLEPGMYDVTESVPAGWTLDEIECDDGSPTNLGTGTASIDLAAGEDVTCTFTDSLAAPDPGTIVIAKVSLGGDGTFEFAGDLQAFAITTTNGTGGMSFPGLEPGTYEVTESVPAGWTLENIQCSDDSTTNLGTGTATIELAQGEGVVCAFVDRLEAPPDPGSITIVKEAVGGDGTFPYSGALGAFGITTTNGSGSVTFPNLEPGTYDVTESVPAGWTLADIVCSDGSTTNLGTATANIDLAEGEDVTCTFTDTVMPLESGTIVITKVSLGGDGTFEFAGDLGAFEITTTDGTGSMVFQNLQPGTYDVSEQVPTSWTLDRILCSNGSPTSVGTATAHIELSGGQGVICGFVDSLGTPVPALPPIALMALMLLLVSGGAWALRRRGSRTVFR